MPDTVTVGQANLLAHITLTNTSAMSVTVCENGNCSGPAAVVTPSCATLSGTGVTCVTPDPGVFAVGVTATVPLGTPCGDNAFIRDFDVTVADAATGGLRLTPRGGLVTLGPAGSPTASCDIRLTFGVAKLPSIDAVAESPGVQTRQIATTQAIVGGPVESASTTDVTTVAPGSPAGETTIPPPPPPPPSSPTECTDCDGDGLPSTIDCDDASAVIHPGAREIAGNKVDENCDGVVEPFPRLDAAIVYSFAFVGRRTRFSELYVRPARAGSTIRVACRGRGCPFQVKKRTLKVTVRRLDLSTLVRKAKLHAGARLEIRVTKPGFVGVLRRLTVRARRRPTQADLCLPPDARLPARCPL